MLEGPITNGYKLKFKFTIGAYGFVYFNKTQNYGY